MVIENFEEHGFIKINNINLHYVSQGTGELMLMLHGFPEFWYSWRHQITKFSDRYRVVAPDLRGYNESDKPQDLAAYDMSELIADVKGIVEGLGYDSCILVAHDWGAAIAWNFAYTYPQMVQKLIVLNIPHPALFAKGLRTPQQLLKSWYIFAFQIPWLPEFLFQLNDYQAIKNAFVEMAIDKTAFPTEDLIAYRDAAAKPGALTAMINYYRQAFKSLFSTQQPQWDILQVPTLTIWGESDTALGKELTYGTEEYVSDWRVRYIPNCSHWVQQEQPELVNQYIEEFLT